MFAESKSLSRLLGENLLLDSPATANVDFVLAGGVVFSAVQINVVTLAA